MIFVLVLLLIAGCAQQRTVPEQIQWDNARAIYKDCQHYYLIERRNKLLWPNPDDLCRIAFREAVKGRLVPWKM